MDQGKDSRGRHSSLLTSPNSHSRACTRCKVYVQIGPECSAGAAADRARASADSEITKSKDVCIRDVKRLRPANRYEGQEPCICRVVAGGGRVSEERQRRTVCMYERTVRCRSKKTENQLTRNKQKNTSGASIVSNQASITSASIASKSALFEIKNTRTPHASTITTVLSKLDCSDSQFAQPFFNSHHKKKLKRAR